MSNRDNHNILIIVMKDDSKVTYSFPFSTLQDEAIRKVMSVGDLNEDNVKEFIWMDETEQDLSMIGDFFDVGENKIDLISHAIGEKLKQVRASRKVIMQKLDIEMIKLLERDESCDECRKHFTKIKKYLRDIPTLMDNYPFRSPREALSFNPYDNVFDLIISNAGSGYPSAPIIEIETPNAHPLRKGFPLKAEAVMEDGSLIDVNITQIGSSYISRPKVTVSAPEEGGEQAVVIASLPENNVNLPPLIRE